jgi:hypothetical protein
MRSYPNFIPLSEREVEHIGHAMAPFSFDRLYGRYFDRVIAAGAELVSRTIWRRSRGRAEIPSASCQSSASAPRGLFDMNPNDPDGPRSSQGAHRRMRH